jgi:hypothetical protein
MRANVPRAREMLTAILPVCTQPTRGVIMQAIALMTRASPVNRAAPKAVHIDAKTRAAVHKMKAAGKSNHEIAEALGLHNGGRVTDILRGER